MRPPVVAAVAVALATAWSSRARADEPCPPDLRYGFDPTPLDECEPPLNDKGGFDVHLAFVSFAPIVRDKSFTASGTADGRPRSFSASGKQLGYDHPRTYGAELGGGYLRRYLRFGVIVGLSSVRSDVAAADTESVRLAAGGALTMAHFGVDGAFIIPIDRVRLGIGAALGAYYVWMHVNGLDPTCSGRRCTSPVADSAIGFVQPRLSFDVALTRERDNPSVSLGGFVGLDIPNGFSPCLGLALSMHTPQLTLAP